ncbi:hypothetical protein [Helicobacter rodentium]|uniref:hypothetical protein n=1 Tax=Helicobacter rodentium TaxID=59617 RepID=UPI002353A6BC|nr:hypothetical protein [Helicobacter rodentium]
MREIRSVSWQSITLTPKKRLQWNPSINSNTKKLYNGISKGKILNYGLPRDFNKTLAMRQMLKTRIFN